jgi:hypothetical protein
MSTPRNPDAAKDEQPPATDENEEGSNAVQHEPDPNAEPIPLPGGEHKYHPRSPYTHGND